MVEIHKDRAISPFSQRAEQHHCSGMGGPSFQPFTHPVILSGEPRRVLRLVPCPTLSLPPPHDYCIHHRPPRPSSQTRICSCVGSLGALSQIWHTQITD